jgi:plastocyanin
MILALAAAGVVALGATHALGASEPITTATTCCAYGKASFTIDRGAVATFENDDPGTSPHDVTSIATGSNNKSLFTSPQINFGQTPINGTNSLAPGTYQFFCTVHPTQMSAQLVVTPSSSPTVALKITSTKLGPVASSGKLQVKLSGILATNKVPLTAKLGKKKLGTTNVTQLAAGSSKKVQLKLSGAGKSALRGKKSAKIKVTATPPGDKTVTASRNLN